MSLIKMSMTAHERFVEICRHISRRGRGLTLRQLGDARALAGRGACTGTRQRSGGKAKGTARARGGRVTREGSQLT